MSCGQSYVMHDIFVHMDDRKSDCMIYTHALG